MFARIRIFLFFCGFIRIGSGRQRAVPHDHVELFRVKGVGHGLGDFLLCQMRQQVSDGEHRIAGVLAQHDLDGRARPL